MAFASPGLNCWLEPGSSVTRSPFTVDSRLSGWWIAVGVLTGTVSPSTRIVSDVTFVGLLLSSCIRQIRPFVDRPARGTNVPVTAVPRPESAR